MREFGARSELGPPVLLVDGVLDGGVEFLLRTHDVTSSPQDEPKLREQVTQQALGEGAEIILGPLFAASVPATAQLTRARGIPVIAFSVGAALTARDRRPRRAKFR